MNRIIYVLFGIFIGLKGFATGFVDGLVYYEILNESEKTVAVASVDYTDPRACGDLQIPEVVYWHDEAYTVTAIRDINYMGTFQYCKFTSVELPYTLTYIGDGAFDGCGKLISISIPNPDTVIKEGAFRYCESLPTIELPNNLTEINSQLFQGCYSLSSIEIPNSVTFIRNQAFQNCNFTSVKVPDAVTSIGWMAFGQCYNLVSIELPNSLTYIDEYAFSDCVSLSSIELPNSVTKIEGRTFYECTNLSYVNMPSVTKISYEAFCDCSSLKTIELPDSLVSIGTKAFFNCNKLKTVNIPESVSSIGSYAFGKCTSLEKIVYTAYNPRYFDRNIFDDKTYQNAILCVPSVALEKCRMMSPWCYFNNITVYHDPNEVEAQSIVLDKTEITLKMNQTAMLYPIIYPENATNKSVIWTSSDPSVAAVDEEGLVTALSKGNAVITATTANSLSASCSVKVNPILVDAILLTPESWNGHPEDSFQINTTVLPEDASDKTLAWTSSDESIAVVDSNGYVMALAPGNVIITAKSTDGSGVGAICSVTVNPILVESIQLTPKNLNGEEGNFYKIAATVLPENASEKTLIWSSSDESVAAVNIKGVVYIHKEGECIITATASDGSDVTAECIVTGVAGIDSIFSENGSFDIYNVNGTLIRKGCDNDYLKTLVPDIYIIRQGNLVKKLIIH